MGETSDGNLPIQKSITKSKKLFDFGNPNIFYMLAAWDMEEENKHDVEIPTIRRQFKKWAEEHVCKFFINVYILLHSI